MKRKNEETGKFEMVSTDMSDDNSSCYSLKPIEIEQYEENDQGDPYENNTGFVIEPLCPEIYGSLKAEESYYKFNPHKDPLQKQKTDHLTLNFMKSGSYELK